VAVYCFLYDLKKLEVNFVFDIIISVSITVLSEKYYN
jgi:hypothetical protein